MSDAQYNTNLAAEFHVLSVLHRLGADATLTLGNKKSVDIAVIKAAGKAITVDVKGLAGTTSWPVDNVKKVKDRHFLVFVCFGGHLHEPTIQPEVWVVPSASLEPFVYNSPKGRRVVPRSTLRSKGARVSKTHGVNSYEGSNLRLQGTRRSASSCFAGTVPARP